jgi:adenine-specific DNA-methyltransferase
LNVLARDIVCLPRELNPCRFRNKILIACDKWGDVDIKELRAQLDEEKLEAFRGTISLPFEPGKHRRVAVKVIDDRGIESLKVINLE